MFDTARFEGDPNCCGLYLGDRFDSWDFVNPFEVFEYSLNILLSFRSFLVP